MAQRRKHPLILGKGNGTEAGLSGGRPLGGGGEWLTANGMTQRPFLDELDEEFNVVGSVQ